MIFLKRHRSGLTMMKTKCHRTILACVVGGCHAGGCFHWRCFPRVHAIAGCIEDCSDMCHILITQRGHLWFLHILDLKGPRVVFLLFHMSVFYGHTCRVAVGSRVTSSLDHVAYFYWSTWWFLVWPRITALFVHISHFYSAMWLDDILPRVGFLIAHVSCSAISHVMH